MDKEKEGKLGQGKHFYHGENKNREGKRGRYDSIATVGESRVGWRADFQSGSRVLKKVF